ncbi:efflux RND transporter periplasmic adaptor subunit [Synechococcus sp. CS-1331]|uniref:efflux RND transporter periplasmic adaptor subunit n=1 Tax=Synechococcus sp. CS-1331 TaxID=2847973 RepID=UPI00223B4A2A|nr:efflux RND transporter periplasmic adaptor subunit [Synechococcus sp. CS-1331]MCT0227636.1 efflux RND transporter periplasmic adaptor subunit [Synechococcus sp. CS-1331]
MQPEIKLPSRVQQGRCSPQAVTPPERIPVPSSLINDPVREILIQEGDRVEAGQPLAILESIDPLSATVRKSEASLQVAQRKLSAQESVIRRYRADLGQAEAEARRARELFASGATSANRMEAQIAEAESASAQLEQAIADRATLDAELVESRASLAKDRSEQAKATIRAPYAGTIFKINARAGDKVGDSGLVEMGNTKQMGVIAEVYQTDLPEIRLGQEATITADGFPGKTGTGRVTEISRQISRQSVFSGESGENVDRRVVEVKIALPENAMAKASRVNYLQVNVLFAPLTAAQRQMRPTQL